MTENLNKIKKLLQLEIDNDTLLRILFDINRYFDKDITKNYKTAQKKMNRVFNSVERKALRTFYYYNLQDVIKDLKINTFPTLQYSADDIRIVTQNTLDRLEKYEPKKILDSIKKRYYNILTKNNSSISHMNDWLEYYNNKRNKLYKYSSFILRISNDDYQKNNCSLQYIFDIIKETYEDLENYRHLLIFIDGQIYDKENNDITWQVAYKCTIYAENFVQYKEKFNPCKKEEEILLLKNFIYSRINKSNTIAEDFYKTISTGYKYEDCYISHNQNKIIISLKKIALDESAIPCPSCLSTIQTGNSYPEMFLRSYECKNPSCQDRSKSGRGKRFDEYGTYRSFKLEENNFNNKISNHLYMDWRRDVFRDEINPYEMLIKYYTWDNESILLYNVNTNIDTYTRKICPYPVEKTISKKNDYINSYSNLPIVKLFNDINNLIIVQCGDKKLCNQLEIINGNSTDVLFSLQPEQIGYAITSPPYYNAREYSQWPNMLLYFIDVLINTKALYCSMRKDGKYLYNIGDIVCEDNVYVRSHMSNRRLPLGFLTCMIFEIVGFNLIENIIWDKGEVQSKRNSTVNLFSGYIKCINCYEHVFVFSKTPVGNNNKKVVQITPVIKINSKGENTYKHTAPYPIELVELLRPYIKNDSYILDPYLGSGTTLKWCRKNNLKGIGIELNKEYYELSNKYIFEE